MRRGRVFFILALILVFGLAAVAVVWFRFLKPAQTTTGQPVATQAIEMTTMVVFTQQVVRGAVLDEIVLGTIPIPRDVFVQGMFSNVADVVGRRAKSDFDANTPVTSGMLVDKAEDLSATGSVAALSIPRGMVAVSIPISRLSSVSYAPQAGDHVNVIVTLMMVDLDADFQTILPNQTAMMIGPGPLAPEFGPEAVTVYQAGDSGTYLAGKAVIDPVLGQSVYVVPGERQRPRLVSQTLLQNAIVLHMDTFALKAADAAQASTSDPAAAVAAATPVPAQSGVVTSSNNPNAVATTEHVPDVITLIVAPQDAVTLNYLLYSGAQLTLALRAAGDDSRVDITAVTLQYLLDQYNIPVPVKLPYGQDPAPVELIQPTLANDLSPTPAP